MLADGSLSSWGDVAGQSRTRWVESRPVGVVSGIVSEVAQEVVVDRGATRLAKNTNEGLTGVPAV